MTIPDGRRRTVIEGVRPQVDGGRFPIKRCVGAEVVVEADVFCDGHDQLAAAVQYRHAATPEWQEAPLEFLVNDHWRGRFRVTREGRWLYRVIAWVDDFLTWRHDLGRRTDPADIAVALVMGAELVDAAAARAQGDDRDRLQLYAARLVDQADVEERRLQGLHDELAVLMARWPDRRLATVQEPALEIVVDRERACFSAWYEMFPRSCDGAAHGSFRDCEGRLPYVAEMGFDVLYLPPIHPIGRTRRKGRNNLLIAAPDDPGSPWAIGAVEGGHKAVHPQLGTLDDFRRFLEKAHEHGLEVALDIAFQCSPDHPYVSEHPEWFRHRPDGSVQYAENPPKKYEDIYPFHFETDAWRELWEELRSVVLFWIDQGVRIFRVDNPHTKPFPFWEWLIDDIKRDHPDVLFLAEAFSRPRIMHRLAKLGFSQSYTYFTWRNTKHEITEYLTELTQGEAAEYFRPNFWPNTPDILPEYLQIGGRPAFMTRLVLAATLSASYGVYGPAFELLEAQPREPGAEEYRNSEKYEIRAWDLERPDSLRDFMARLNRIRRENPALRRNTNLRFHNVDNDRLLAYSKSTEDGDNVILVVVNLDPDYAQSGWLTLPIERFGVDRHHSYQVHDLLTGARYLWQGERNFVRLDPRHTPAAIFRLRRRLRSERDFEYFM
ncbi:MAG: alpha-1,4-glucan--maltose-1-phosphate maltosyltransferase [Thiohalomonadaceae bacterium]